MKPKELFEIAENLNPDGVTDRDFIPIRLAGQTLELRYDFDHDSRNKILFHIFVPETDFARRSFELTRDGRFREGPASGCFPTRDLTDNEPRFEPSISYKESNFMDAISLTLMEHEPDVGEKISNIRRIRPH